MDTAPRGDRQRRQRVRRRRDSNFVQVAAQIAQTREVLERFDPGAMDPHDLEWLKRELSLLDQQVRRVLA